MECEWFKETSEQKNSFSYGGYYSVDLSINSGSPNLKVIVLNTVLFSIKHKPNTTFILDPLGQLNWLSSQLNQARSNNQKSFFIFHLFCILSFFCLTRDDVDRIKGCLSQATFLPDRVHTKTKSFGSSHTSVNTLTSQFPFEFSSLLFSSRSSPQHRKSMQM